MARLRGSKQKMEPCYVCGLPEPRGKYHEFPWHLTCVYDEAGRKKAAQWKKAQQKIAESEIPTLI
jgi:hypothetical protein